MLPQRRALPVVRSLSWSGYSEDQDARGSGGKKGTTSLGCPGLCGDQDAPPVSLTSPTFRFCGLIQALVTNPDSTAPAEEAEGVGEVLEVRTRDWELAEGEGPRALLNPISLRARQFDYEYTETGERLVLGKGTYGVVYAGRDRHTRVRIAIKEIPERDSRCGAWPRGRG